MRPPVWQLVNEATAAIGGEMTYAQIKQYVWSTHADVNPSTLTCQIIICSVNHPSRVHYPENKKPRISTGQYDFLYNVGRGRVVRYDPEVHGAWEIAEKNGQLTVRTTQDSVIDAVTPTEREDDQGSSFAYESHLRDYLARNLPVLNGGKVPLRQFVSDDGRDGVEFQTDVGPIDILARSADGDFYVFELKLGRGPDAALGQILRYMGWVKQHLCNGKNVYGVVIASDITTKLRYAATQVPHVQLMEYELSVELTPVSITSA